MQARVDERPKAMRAAAILLALIVAFLWTAIAKFGTHSYTAADLTQDYALTALGGLLPDGRPAHAVANHMLGDTLVEMQPWLEFNRRELESGRWPLWNPYNGAGVPHLANFQSAVFSPFSLPFYVLPFKLALILSAALKLFALGFFTFLFLRTIELSFQASIVGATAFTFAGVNVLLLGYPHPAATAALPAGLYFVERTLRAFESGAPRRSIAFGCAAVCATLAIGLFAGQPEPFAFAALVVASWSAWRLTQLAVAARRAGGSIAPVAGLALGLTASAAIAAALAAPQTLPFLEYLRHSATFTTRKPIVEPSIAAQWPLAIFPDALGSPLAGCAISVDLPPPNYEQVNCSYAGAAVLLLGAIGLVFARSDRRARFFGVAAIAWLAVTCNVAGLGRAWDAAPVLGNYLPLSRSQAVWLFALAVLAAIAIERAVGSAAGPRRKTLSAFAIALGAAMLASSWIGERELSTAAIETVDVVARSAVAAHIRATESWIAGSFALAVLAIGAAFWIANAGWRRTLGVAILAIVFGETGWMLRDYNPTIEDRFVSPKSAAIETLQREVGDARMMVLSDNGIPPDTNLAYGLRMLQSYDALPQSRYSGLIAVAFGAIGGWEFQRRASPSMLDLFGVEYVVTPDDWAPIGTGESPRHWTELSRYEPIRLRRETRVVQAFVCNANELESIAVFAATPTNSATHESDLHVRVVDDRGGTLAERTFRAGDLRERSSSRRELALTWHPFATDDEFSARWVELAFAPQADSAGRTYRIEFDAPHGDGDDATILWHSKPTRRNDGGESIDGQLVADARMLFDYRSGPPNCTPVARVANFTLQRYEHALGSYFAVASGVISPRADQAFAIVTHPRFDPRRDVAIEFGDDDQAGRSTPPAGFELRADDLVASQWLDKKQAELRSATFEPATRARTLSSTPTDVRVEVERSTPGYLVAAQRFFPGWKVFVGGVEKPLLCANYVFDAVQIPAGKVEVEFVYAPRSFALGGWIALAGLVVGGALLAATARGAQGERRGAVAP